jgi:putative peptidoglycan lipid II flippase
LKAIGAWRSQPGWGKFGLQLSLANGALVAVILWLNAPVNQWLAAGGFQRSQDMAILVIAGTLAYFVTLALAGVRIRHFRHR